MLQALQHDARRAAGLDVVKVAHHGSANRDDGLLALARAPVAVVSVGADNDYGHPAPSTLSTLAEDGFRVYRTDLAGRRRRPEGRRRLGRGGDHAVIGWR